VTGPTTRLPFDRYQRYARAARAVDALRIDGRPLRVLEVGANFHRDLERFLPADAVIYLDVRAPEEDGAGSCFVRGDGSASPFGDDAVDVVVALDVLEHVEPSRRHALIAEALRVAARAVVIAAPFDSPEVAAQDARLHEYFRELHGRDFVWLAEHASCGLPSLGDTVESVRGLEWHVTVAGAGNLELWAKLMRAHFLVAASPELTELRADLDEAFNLALAGRDVAPPVYRHFVAAASDPADLARLEQALAGGPVPDAATLERLNEPLDALLEAGERAQARHAREEVEKERSARAAAEAKGTLRIGQLETDVRYLRERLRASEAQVSRMAAELQRGLVPSARRTLRRAAAGVSWLVERAATFGTVVSMLWRSRVHTMALEVLGGVVVDGDGHRSLGDDPQLLLRSSRRRPPRGWVQIGFDIETRGPWLSPKLYVDAGRGFSEGQSHPLQVRRGGRVDAVLRLPDRVRALRLDPLATSGPFAIRDVTIREIGITQLTRAILPHLPPFVPRAQDLGRLVRRARRILRAGGARAIAQRVLTLENEQADYQTWVDTYDTLGDADRTRIRRHVEALPFRPTISIVMPTYETPEPWLRRAIESVRNQLYPDWELCIADDGSTEPHVHRLLEEYRLLDPRIRVVHRHRRGHISAASNSALELASGDYVALLDHDDELAERALYSMAVEINAHPSAELIYSDEDKITAEGRRCDPYFKPDWNPDLFLAQNLVTHLCVARTARVREVGGFRVGYEGAQDWDLAMRIAERVGASRIRHVPEILYHWRIVPGSTAMAVAEKSYAPEAQRNTLVSHFERVGAPADVLPVAGICWRIKYPLPRPAPWVTAIIPTRDRVDLLRRCIDSLRIHTAYPRLELVVVDNQSTDPMTLAYLKDLAATPGITVLRYDAPFNYSAINNLGARHARGEMLALLNNDVEVAASGWLEEMVSQACRPEIGAVGAMLYYPNDTIQHAGVILGIGGSGIAAHAYAYRPRGWAGQIGRALLVQSLSAVTAACLVVRRAVYEEVGGFDEHLGIAYNDVDFCLRVRARGYRNLWTPHAELYHHESASRGLENTPAKLERLARDAEYMRRRWGTVLDTDPAYNPKLALDGDSFGLAFPPRGRKPWLEPIADDASADEQAETLREAESA
jgi:GT2 family glycosyltransferase